MTIAAAITWIGSFVPTKVKNYFVKPTTSAAVANGETRAMVPRRARRRSVKHLRKQQRLQQARNRRRYRRTHRTSRRKALSLHLSMHGFKKPTDPEIVNKRKYGNGFPQGKKRGKNTPPEHMTAKQIRYGEDLVTNRQTIFVTNNTPHNGYMSKATMIAHLHPLIDVAMQRVLKHGTPPLYRNKRGTLSRSDFKIHNPIPFLFRLIFHLLDYKIDGNGPNIPSDFDFDFWTGLNATYVNASILPVLKNIIDLPTKYPGRSGVWPIGFYIEFLQEAFLRRLRDRRNEPKTMYPEDSDPEDQFDYESDVYVEPLWERDWDDYMIGSFENYHVDCSDDSVITNPPEDSSESEDSDSDEGSSTEDDSDEE